MLFTRRFVQDLFILGIFFILFYALTNNPITYPKPQATSDRWSIQLMQHPLVFGLAGHNYLVLRDNNNAIVRELHGLATDSTTNLWKYVGTKNTDKLKVWEFNGSRYYVAQKNYAGTVLYEGDEYETVSIWNKNSTCKQEINTKNLPYPPYGVKITGDTENSNSVAYTLTLCMGLDPKRIGLITPGWGKNLLEEDTQN